jgi:uncharacterized protein (DUF952 family)
MYGRTKKIATYSAPTKANVNLAGIAFFYDGLNEAGIVTAMTKRLIYHMCKRYDWQNAKESGLYVGSADDLADGFLHFSTAEQVAESAARHRAGIADLLLITVDANNLGPSLKWEPSRADQLFPHLYGSVVVAKVISVCDLPLGEDGFHEFPDDIAPWRPAEGEGSNV